MLAWIALIAGIAAGTCMGVAISGLVTERRHSCMPHEPDVCRGVSSNNEMRTRFRGSRS